MLYLFFGDDDFRSRQMLRAFTGGLLQNKASAFSVARFDADSFRKDFFLELARGNSLFGDRKIVICENLFQETGAADFLEENLKFCADSEDIFVFWEKGTKIPAIEKLKKIADKAEECKNLSLGQIRNWLKEEITRRNIKIPAGLCEELIRRCGNNLWLFSQELEKYALSRQSESFLAPPIKQENFFQITDAISEKNRSKSWFLFEKAVMAGADPEEIFWKIVWQIKNLLIVKKFAFIPGKKIAEETGLHSFVVKKAVLGAGFFTEEELSRHSIKLINLYHNSRRGLMSFEAGIENFLIKI